MAQVRGGTGGAAYAWSLVFFGAGFLICLLLAIIFFTQVSGAQERAKEAQAQLARFASPAQQASPELAPLLNDPKKTAVGQLLAENGTLKALIVGDRLVAAEALDQSIQDLHVTGTLVNAINTSRAELDAANQRVADASDEQKKAVLRAQAAETTSNQLQQIFAKTTADLTRLVTKQGKGAQTLAASIKDMESTFTGQIASIRSKMQAELSTRDDQIVKLEREKRKLEQELNNRDKPGQGISPSTSADARVTSVLADGKKVYLDRGRNDRIQLGMTFEIFPSGELIKLDNYNDLRGIATVEVIDINASSSLARVVRLNPGATITPSDVAANVAYDPHATPKFYVYGDFDIDHQGDFTLADQQRVKNMIQRYGGAIQDALTPDTDFLVLGQDLVLPDPPPAGTTDPTLLQAYVQATKDFETYQKLTDEARSLAIPVLNQNRFLALVGYYQR